MRLIDADALLRDIEKYHVSEGKFQHWLELQPTVEPASPWHRVEERLPDKKTDAIFYYEWTGISGTVYRETSIISLNELIVLGCRPIEWTEIPERREPPKEDA